MAIRTVVIDALCCLQARVLDLVETLVDEKGGEDRLPGTWDTMNPEASGWRSGV